MDDIELSFIVPVYNVEDYLNECLDSIIVQIEGMNCVEIILVDDGSTDNSGTICDEYGKIYSYIQVIHQKNLGLSCARNAGLKVASGKYIAFVDSDDKITQGSLQKIISWVEKTKADIYFMQAKKFYSNGYKVDLGDGINHKNIYGRSKREVIKFIAKSKKYPGSACTKLYRRAFLIEAGLYFPNDRRYSEDLGFVRDCLLTANSFDCIDIPYYEYRQNREGSITNSFSIKKFNDIVTFLSDSIEIADRGEKEYKKYIMSFVAYEYCILLWHLSDVTKGYDEAYSILLKYAWVQKYGMNIKIKCIYLCTKLLGIRYTSCLLKKMKK